ncbi:MAG: 30S ribosome-binding factor RbfA [Chloroflexota bacterium]
MPHRIERLNNLLRREISELLQRQVKDPRLSEFIAVTEVITSPDLKYAKVFISFIGSDEEKKQALSVLTAAAGFFRKELAGSIRLRRVPDLSFHWDNSIERGDHLLQLMDQINAEHDD